MSDTPTQSRLVDALLTKGGAAFTAPNQPTPWPVDLDYAQGTWTVRSTERVVTVTDDDFTAQVQELLWQRGLMLNLAGLATLHETMIQVAVRYLLQ